jgi:hypothetical protein
LQENDDDASTPLPKKNEPELQTTTTKQQQRQQKHHLPITTDYSKINEDNDAAISTTSNSPALPLSLFDRRPSNDFLLLL